MPVCKIAVPYFSVNLWLSLFLVFLVILGDESTSFIRLLDFGTLHTFTNSFRNVMTVSWLVSFQVFATELFLSTAISKYGFDVMFSLCRFPVNSIWVSSFALCFGRFNFVSVWVIWNFKFLRPLSQADHGFIFFLKICPFFRPRRRLLHHWTFCYSGVTDLTTCKTFRAAYGGFFRYYHASSNNKISQRCVSFVATVLFELGFWSVLLS